MSTDVSQASPTVAPRGDHLIDPATLMRIKSLQLRAKAVVEGFYNGLHRSPFFGFSVEFSEYRPYVLGDDPRSLDWKLFARSDRYYIKRFEDETNRRCYFAVDQSRSMGYQSIGYSKAEYARTLAATLSLFLTQQRDCVGLLTFDQQVREYLPARYRPGHFQRLLTLLQQSLAGQGTGIAEPLEQLAMMVRKRALMVLVSDLLSPLEALSKPLAYLRSRGHEVLLLRILDPAELSLDLTEPLMLQDLETGQRMYINPADARQEYQQRFDEHATQLRQMCDALGIQLATLRTDQPLEFALFELVRSQLGRQANLLRDPRGTAARGGTWP